MRFVLLKVKDSSEPFIYWLQPRIKKIEGDVPILVIVLCFPLNDMESIYVPTLQTPIRLTLVQHIPMDNNQSTYNQPPQTDFLPAEHSSTLNSSSSGSTKSSAMEMNPVPPSSILTNRFVILLVLCDPGTNDKHPFVMVQSSKANQNPTADGGSVYKNTES